ncbi:hypothetical protein [Amycolatopsis aidingensis]|uniref:hypothetical protein n=1 Tax=Amycolatopsis aidingensis TaxID=2842453 RepID=UPI001C0D836F|nr:hypothetical protein [Amycolatopsis aidingensis]
MPLLACVLSFMLLAGCGAGEAGPGSAEPLPPRVSAPATLLPDGTVPWVDEPAGESEFRAPPRERRTDPDAGPCQAGQLRGELTSWLSPGNTDGGEHTVRAQAGAKLIGYAKVTNTGRENCRLRGEVDTRLRDRNGEVPIGYSHAVNREGAQRVTIVPPGKAAELRLDWSGPFCAPVDGPLELAIHLPEDGGELRAPVRTDKTPPCGRGGTGPQSTSHLAASSFDEPARETTPDSPLSVLRATIEPVPAGKAGELVTYHVRLANPTGSAVSLDPCPGYLQERFSLGNHQVAAVNESELYRLNCRPVTEIPANGSVRFAMGLRIPAELAPGRKLSVSWRLLAPGLAGEPGLRGGFELTVR